MIAFANRASAILYNLLMMRQDRRPFLLPANICPIVPLVFHKAQVPFEFVDISAKDYCMDENRVAELVRTHRYCGVLMARTYGYYSDRSSFFAEIRRIDEDILLVDDRCLCAPSFERRSDGADVVLYSTGPKKYVDLGFGAYAFIKEHVPYRHCTLSYSEIRLRSLEREYKHCIEYREKFVYRDCDWLDGRAPAFDIMEYRDQIHSEISSAEARKSRFNEYYRSVLTPEVQLGENWNSWRFCIRVRKKTRLLKKIFSRGLFASSHYSSLAGVFGPGETPVASRLHNSILNLFNDRHISFNQVEELASLVNNHAQETGADTSGEQ